MLNRCLVLVMALVAVVLIAGCGGSSGPAEQTTDAAQEHASETGEPEGGKAVVDPEKTAARIKAEIEAVLGKKIKIVECPDDQEVVPAARFKCAVTFADGDEATAALKILDAKPEVKIVGLKPAG